MAPSIGIAVRMTTRSKLVADFVRQAMADEVLKCADEGLMGEAYAAIIHTRMMAVRDDIMEQLRQQEEAQLPK